MVHTGVTFSLAQYSTPILSRAKQEADFMYTPGYVLHNPGVNGYSVSVLPLCVLEYGAHKNATPEK